MSIEQQLQDLTNAVKQLTVVIAEGIKPGSTKEAPKAEDKKPSPKPEPAAASAAPPADTAPATPEPTAAASGGELDYDKDVKPAFLKLVQTKGRQAGRKIIDAFNPTKEKLSEALKPDQYADALKLIAKELA